MTQVNKKRVFTIAWEFPPRMSGESVVCLRTLKNSSLSYDVYCGLADSAYKENLPINIRTFPYPGKYIRWPIGALHLFNRLDKEEDYRVLYSRVMPANGHMAALLVKIFHPRLKWVAYFSDPIWNSPFIRFPFPWRNNNTHRPNYWLMKLFGIPAKIAMKKCDMLIFNNERLAKYVTGKHYTEYEKKICIIPYENEDVNIRPPRKPDGTFVLAHVGQIYGNRSLKNIVEAVEMLKREQPKLFSHLIFRQVGFICQAELKRIRRSTAVSAFKILGQVPYEESIEEMYRADCLLTIDPEFDDPRKNIYIPAKIFDYMSTGRPIIAIAERDSATGDMIANTEIVRIEPDSREIYSVLKTYIENSINGKIPYTLYSQFCIEKSNLLDEKFNYWNCSIADK